jgi:hypothetical protein
MFEDMYGKLVNRAYENTMAMCDGVTSDHRYKN